MKKYKAITLVELLISTSIFSVIAVIIYSSFHTGIFGYRSINETIEINQTARQVFERFDLDLRNSFAYSKEETRFSGDKTNISFLSLIDKFQVDAITKDYAGVSYSLSADKLMRRCRYAADSLNDKSETPADEMSADIASLEFSYAYLDTNSSEKSLIFRENTPDDKKTLPQAVRIKLAIKGKTRQNFEKTVYLPLTKTE
jgi:type II secretory pathway component PulJ